MTGCKHTQQVHNKPDVIESYELAIKLLNSNIPKEFYCGVEGCRDLIPCRVCLECPFVGCVKTHGKLHSNEQGHYLGVDLIDGSDGSLYCYSCEDYILDEKFEKLKTKSNSASGLLPPYQASTGLRGFYNMGATCFMSVILQSFIHNPFMRNFFLVGGHDPNQCPLHNNKPEGESCLACSVDEVFMDFFRYNNAQGYGLTNVLVASWKVKRALAGGSEQDAHEFLQFILNEFHKTHFQSDIFSQKEESLSINGNGSNTHHTSDISCPCVAHRTFCGELESKIKCHNCGNVTSKIDPMMDLSLEIQKKKKNGAKATLMDCLDKFTGTEKLDAKYHCEVCDSQQSVDKSLYIKRLPVSLCIQLKRFEHGISSTKAGVTGSKVETPVEFPLYIDFSRYTSDTPEGPFNYELYGVVCHQGSLHSGHYTCYMKNRLGNWFHFDDAMVTSVTAKEALSSGNAYLLFYVIDRL